MSGLENSLIDEPYFYLVLTGYLYFVIMILPYIIFGFYFTYGIISIPDMFDVLLYPTIIGFLLLQIGKKTRANETQKTLYYYFLLIHMYGSGFHWAANAIHETIKNTVPQGSADAVSRALTYAYLLDEIVSHKIFFYAMFAILFIIAYWSKNASETVKGNMQMIGDISSIIAGFSIAVSLLEGQTALEGAIFAIFMVLYIYVNQKSFKAILEKPSQRYLFFMMVTTLIIFLLTLILFGKFIEPSEIIA